MSGNWRELDRSLTWILDNVNVNEFVIVGAGVRGKQLVDKLLERNMVPQCIFDNSEKLWGNNKAGVSIQKPIKLTESTDYIIAIDSVKAREEVKTQLIDLGIEERNIYIYYGSNYQFWRELDDTYYQREISALYKVTFDKEMDWENPKSYNEKLNWEKLHIHDERKTILADKYLVREWIAETIGNKYLNTLYGVWDNADDIDFGKLPESFVLKCNHGSGCNIIVKNKQELDVSEARKQLNEWLGVNTFYLGFEWQYKNIPPKIICEAYLEGMAETVYDYNVLCFHGEPKYIICISGCHTAQGRAAFYDTEWKKQEFSHEGYPYDPVEAPKPEQLDEMLALSRILSKDFNHVRVDWYNMPDGRVLFGEMTFTTWNGLKRFEPEEWDLKLGELI